MEWQPSELFYYKNVSLLLHKDVTRRNGEVYTATLSELAGLRKTDQFKKDVRFHEDMTEVDVANTLKEVFPVLQNERFSCAASTKKNNARLDFHGERRVWDGRTIKRKITGHRCLYIVLDVEVAHTVDDVTVSASQPVENESPQGAVQQPRGIPMSPVSSQSVQSTSIHGGFPLTQKCHLQPLATLGPAGIQVFQPTQKYQLQPVATLGRGTQTVQGPSSANVTRDSLKVDAVISTNDTSESNLSLTDSDLEDLMAYNEDMPTDQMDSLLSRSSVLSDGERTSKETEAMFAANKQQEITAQGLTSAPTITDSSGYYSEGSLSQPTEVSNKQKNDIVMNPSWGPLEGGTWFSINLNTKFQSHGHLLAIFAGIAEQKRVVKYEGNVWVGNTPRGNSPGTVPVVFRTPTSNGENGIEVGRASFTYFDERLLCNTDLQLPFFSNMEEQQRNNGANGGDDSDNSNASVLEQQAVDVLRWSLYTAAKNGFNQFIRLIFGTSAGRIIFETYKNKTALPEDIADANGHNDIAVYLREITERFSKEGRPGPAQSKIINWSELVRAVKESDSDHYEVEEKRWKDESLEKAYFADVSSSDSDKDTTDSDEELKRIDFKDQDSIGIHHVSKRDEQQWREDDILRSVDTSGDKKLSTSSEREKDDSGDRPHAKSGQDAFRVVEHSPHNLGVALLQASLFDESEEDNQESHDEDVEELEEGVTIIISGISSSTTEDAVLNYFENSRRSGGGEVGQIKFNGHAGEAVITFLEVKDRQRLLEGEHSINKTPITVNLQPPKKKVPADPVRIHVQGLSEKTTADCLCFYLEKFSGVDVEVYFCTKNNALDIFHCKPGVQNVIQRKHALEGKKLNVTPHYPFLQDTTTMRVEMKCDPEVFEYIQINHGSKLQVVLEENKIEIEISKDSQAQAIIVSSAGNKTNCDRPWDERLSHLESFLQSFKRSQLDIASEIFDEIERRWEKSVSTAESSDFLVSFDDHKRIVKIIGKTSHVDKEWATMKELIQTVQQDTERMKTVVQVVEGNIPTSKLTLLGMSGICERLRDKHRHLDITVDSKGQKLALKGPRSLLQEAKVEVFTFISKIVERTIELPEKVINVLKSPPVSSFLQDLLKQRAICAVVLYGQGQSSNEVKVVGIDSSTAKKAENVLQDTILEKCYQLTSENVQLLGSGLSIDFQTSIASRFIDGITVNSASSIIWVCDTLKDRQECFQEVKEILKKSMELTQVRKSKIEAMKERLVDSSIDMRFSADSEGIEVSGTSEGLKRCLPQFDDFISAVQKKSLPIDRPGMKKYFLKGKGPIVLKVTEEKHHCIIAALEHADDEEKLAHGTMRTKAKNQEPICSYLSKEEKNIFVIKGDIMKDYVGAIVNAANGELNHVRDHAARFVRAGVKEIQGEYTSRLHSSFLEDQSIFSSVGRLPCHKVIHAVGSKSDSMADKWIKVETPTPQKRYFFSKLIKIASDCRSAAIPAASSGVFGFPRYRCTKGIYGEDKFWVGNTVRVEAAVTLKFKDQVNCGPAAFWLRAKTNEGGWGITKSPRSLTTQGMKVGDIAQEKADAIVGRAASNLDLDCNPCAKVLSQAAGPSLQRGCANIGSVAVGDIAVNTQTGDLNCNAVIFAICSEWDSGKGGKDTRNMSDVLVKDLSFEAHHRMDVLLLPLNSGRDWKTLEDKMGYSHEEIRYLESKREPVKELIRDYESKGRTVSELLSLLREMERQDLIDDLQEYIESAAKEKEKVVSEMQQTCAVLNKEVKTLCESYDVFICYAGPDKPFAEELVKTLEGQPYCMKVCIDYRDFLSPGDHLETAAEAIEERCRKVLLILSENFHRCHVADFQAKIALSLSIEARKRILIPILYKPCKIPTMLKFIYYVDYTTEDARKYFWKKLVASLGYRNGST